MIIYVHNDDKEIIIIHSNNYIDHSVSFKNLPTQKSIRK